MAAPPAIETERLVLRALAREDAPAVFDYASLPESSRYLSWSPHRSLADSDRFIDVVLAGYASGAPPLWAVTEGGHAVGTICFLEHSRVHAHAALGYVISPLCWGRGLATEAARAVVDHGFSDECLGLNRIEAQVRVENAASARVLEKVGLRREAVLRQRFRIDGAFHDTSMHALLRSDWEHEHLSGSVPRS
jgi:ribosomal-protein-alanine N-acetyltransferase